VKGDSPVDELYGKPLDEFVTARDALAKTLSGDEAARVKRLRKPTLVPWAVNQVFWHDRAAYERLIDRGARLRAAQIAALEGRRSDVSAAADAHRQALHDVVKAAERFASGAGARIDPDQLARSLEAVSLTQALPEPHGRLTQPLRPAGFDALAGVVPKVQQHSATPTAPARKTTAGGKNLERGGRTSSPAEARRARAAAAAAAGRARNRARAITRAHALVERARAQESRARDAWQQSKSALEQAQRRLSQVEADADEE
jgi:hypothetical protein